MKRWGLRHKGFRIGFIGVVVCSVFFVVGFAAPAWRNTAGLWMDCSSSHKMCVPHSKEVIAAWFHTVRTFECFALVAIILCIGAEFYFDFLAAPSPDRRLVELLALIGGKCGLIGSIIFAAFTPITSSSNYHYHIYLSWGFGLATASSCFIVAFASVIAFFRRKGLDVANYASTRAVHYNASDGSVRPQGLPSMSVSPPTYHEAVTQPVGSGPRPSGPGPEFKPPALLDSQPPPAYFPPPPSGQFQAPPPYTAPAPPALAGSGGGPVSLAEPRSGLGQTTGSGQLSSESHPGVSDASSPPVSSEMDPTIPGNPVVSVPAYYVTVLGQMVPVFREELQQAGQDAPPAQVPSCFIVTQGQHVPVYSEEQVQAFSN